VRVPFASLSPDDLRSLAVNLASGRLVLPVDGVDLHRHLGPLARPETAQELNDLLLRGFTPAQVAAVLELLAAERQRARAIQDRVELVWTGPEAPGSRTRDTWTVVQDLFCAAERTVLIACFAIHSGATMFAALAKRMNEIPDLRVRLFVNVHAERDHSSDPPTVLDRFASHFKSVAWPAGRLPETYYDPRSLDPNPSSRAVLHAKCIVVDESISFVTSANFTAAAQERNIEAGVLLNDAHFARTLCEQFERLVNRGELKRIPYL
jgi:phosphatidylserine/phosphatidylglycerophosphate/cardiolipin synthase-like enzyme